MLTYAGVDIGCSDPALVEYFQALIPPDHLHDLTRVSWPGTALAALGWDSQTRMRPPELNTLFWPVGSAQEHAVGYFLVSEFDLATIRTTVYSGTSSAATAQNLVLDDGITGRKLTVPMWMLPPRPLGSNPNGNVWLLTLVDARYFWWQRAAAISVTAGTTTWASLFASIASALGITLTVDSVPSAYGKPPADFGTSYEYLPPLLDAACRSVGMRLVAGLDGTYRVWSSTSALSQVTTNLATVTNGTSAGGAISLSSPVDVNALLPASVTVAFPVVNSSVPDGTWYTENITLSSLALTGLTTAAGTSGTRLHRSSLPANGSSPSNTSELSSLATQLATDYYQWAQAGADRVYSGIPAGWTLCGMEQSIEFRHDFRNIYTRIQRPPWDRQTTTLLHYGTYGSVNNFYSFVHSTVAFTDSTITFNGDSITLTDDTITSGGGNSIAFASNDTLTINGPVILDGTATITLNGPTFNFTGGDSTTWNFGSGSVLILSGSPTWYIDNSWALDAALNVEVGLYGPGWYTFYGGCNVDSWLTWSCTQTSLATGTTNNWVPSPATGFITNATNASPIVLTVPGWYEQPQVGDLIWVTGVGGNTAANNLWRVQASTPTTVTLANSTGNGAYTSGGVILTTKTVINVISNNTSVLTGMVPAAFGEVVNSGDITGATNASPIVLTVPGWVTTPQVGQAVMVAGVKGNYAANGIWTVQAVTATTLTLQNTTGNGAFAASAGSTIQLAQPQLVVLNYLGSGSLTLNNASASSDPANRFYLPPTYGSSVKLSQGDSCVLWWDYCTNFNWRMISCTVDIDPVFVAAGASHATGLVPDPGSTSHANPYLLGDNANWIQLTGSGVSYASGVYTISGGAVSLAVGTTTVSGGTNPYVLYDNAGTLGAAASVASLSSVNVVAGVLQLSGDSVSPGDSAYYGTNSGGLKGWYGLPVTSVNGATGAVTLAAMPTGTVIAYGSATTPTGYLPCDGSAVSRTTYSALFAVVGTLWGAGDGSTTFGVPDLRGRNVVGTDGSGVNMPVAKPVPGNSGGEEQHTLIINEMPAHQHTFPSTLLQDGRTGGTYGTGAFNMGYPASNLTSTSGSGAAHNNMPPWLCVPRYIKT